MAEPWLSVIMPTYNGERYLASALTSVLDQENSGLEVIAVDDGSTDATLDILEYFQSQMSVTIVRRQHCGNWVAGTNHGLTLARGSHACLLHQDDRWVRERIRLLSPLVRRTPSALILHPSHFIDDLDNRVGRWSCPLPDRRCLNPRFVIPRLLIQNFVATPAPIFPRDLALRVGGLDENLWYSADWDFWLKLACATETVYLDEPLAEFRIHPSSQTIRRSVEQAAFKEQLVTVLYRHLDQCGDAVSEPYVRAAFYSVEVNTFLAAYAHGKVNNVLRLLWRFVRMGPAAWRVFFRDSRVIERVAARRRLAGRGRISQPSAAGHQ